MVQILSNRERKFSIVLLLAAIAFASCSGGKTKTDAAAGEVNTAVATIEPQAAVNKKLPFERGSYVEESKVMGMDMHKTVYFDRWGDWAAVQLQMDSKSGGKLIDKMEITKGNTHWDFDLEEKTGKTYESSRPSSGMAGALGTDISNPKNLPKGMEVKEQGTEDYLGYKCKKLWINYPSMEMEGTVLVYENLSMQVKAKMGKMEIDTKITSIDLSAPPASIFEVPADINITKN
jgi:hypothetical protein